MIHNSKKSSGVIEKGSDGGQALFSRRACPLGRCISGPNAGSKMLRGIISRKRKQMQTGKRVASWSVPLIITLLALPASASGLAGQNAGEASSPATPGVESSWPEVNLNVVVLDKHGVPQKVDERKFQLLEDGAERPLKPQDSRDSPVSLALVIDSSGSIFKQKPAIVSAVTAIIKAMPAGSETMAVLFADREYLDLPFTPISKVDFSFLDRLQASGPTALNDAVFLAEDYIIAHAKYARRSLVILSDGEDNASHVSRVAVIRKMEQPGAPIVYACPVSRGNIMQSELMVGRINMRFLAKWGGGTEFNLDPDPASAAAQVAAAIRSQYVLEFAAADAARNGKKHKVAVRLPGEDVQIHALPDYFAPAK